MGLRLSVSAENTKIAEENNNTPTGPLVAADTVITACLMCNVTRCDSSASTLLYNCITYDQNQKSIKTTNIQLHITSCNARPSPLQRLSFNNCTGRAFHPAQRDQYICFPSKSRFSLPLPFTGYVKSQDAEQFVVPARCRRLLRACTIRDALQSHIATVVAWPPACPASRHMGLERLPTESS